MAIGDTTTDAFIKIKDASVNCDIKHEHCKLCVDFGAKIPYEFVEVVKAVGNSANAAVAAARLGVNSALVSDLGADLIGRDSISYLRKENVETEYVRMHRGIDSNYHYVLWYDAERTILVKHHEYPYALPKDLSAKWLYLSSLGESALAYQDEIAKFVETHPEVKLAYQPGTFQIKMGVERFKTFYTRAEVFICNTDEARQILKNDTDDIKQLLSGMRALGPKIAVITDGPAGAYTYDGTTMLFMPPYPDPKPPYERTGAGDAFASTFVSALTLGKSIEVALKWAPINSMSVVQQIGAQRGLLTLPDLEKFLASAPTDYFPKKI